MSYILEALKKLEQKKQAEMTAESLISNEGIQKKEAGKRSRLLYIALLIVVILGISASSWIIFNQFFTSPKNVALPPQPELTVKPSVATQPTEPIAAPSPQPTYKDEPIGGKLAPQTTMAPTASEPQMPPERPQQPSQEPEKKQTIYTLEDLPASVRQSLPELRISGIYHSQGSGRQSIAFINGKSCTEGSLISDTVKVERITQDNVIFSYQGYRFKKGLF